MDLVLKTLQSVLQKLYCWILKFYNETIVISTNKQKSSKNSPKDVRSGPLEWGNIDILAAAV